MHYVCRITATACKALAHNYGCGAGEEQIRVKVIPHPVYVFAIVAFVVLVVFRHFSMGTSHGYLTLEDLLRGSGDDRSLSEFGHCGA